MGQLLLKLNSFVNRFYVLVKMARNDRKKPFPGTTICPTTKDDLEIIDFDSIELVFYSC